MKRLKLLGGGVEGKVYLLPDKKRVKKVWSGKRNIHAPTNDVSVVNITERMQDAQVTLNKLPKTLKSLFALPKFYGCKMEEGKVVSVHEYIAPEIPPLSFTDHKLLLLEERIGKYFKDVQLRWGFSHGKPGTNTLYHDGKFYLVDASTWPY